MGRVKMGLSGRVRQTGPPEPPGTSLPDPGGEERLAPPESRHLPQMTPYPAMAPPGQTEAGPSSSGGLEKD